MVFQYRTFGCNFGVPSVREHEQDSCRYITDDLNTLIILIVLNTLIILPLLYIIIILNNLIVLNTLIIITPLCRSYRPTRCPSLTCGEWPAAALLSDHIAAEHDGTVRGKDVVVRTGTNRLVSSYVNVDREPIFYKETKTSWVANELVLGR